MRLEPITDPEGDRVLERERRDRQAEKGSDPSIFLGPLDRCDDCGLVPTEFQPGFWVCACGLPVVNL